MECHELLWYSCQKLTCDDNACHCFDVFDSVSGLVTAIVEGFKGLPIRMKWMGGLVEEDKDEFQRLVELQKLEKTQVRNLS